CVSSRRRHTRFSRDWSSDGALPILIEAMVRRFQPHSSDDDDRTYRPAEELELMRSEGPLRVTGKRLRDMGVIDDAWEEDARNRKIGRASCREGELTPGVEGSVIMQ